MNIIEAIASIQATLTDKYDQTEKDRDYASAAHERAYRGCEAAGKAAGIVLARYIRGRLRPHRVELSKRIFAIDYHGPKPATASISVDVCCSLNDPHCHTRMRMKLVANLWPTNQAELDDMLQRMKAALDAHAGVLAQQGFVAGGKKAANP
mgnify:CR=1 FL=1